MYGNAALNSLEIRLYHRTSAISVPWHFRNGHPAAPETGFIFQFPEWKENFSFSASVFPSICGQLPVCCSQSVVKFSSLFFPFFFFFFLASIPFHFKFDWYCGSWLAPWSVCHFAWFSFAISWFFQIPELLGLIFIFPTSRSCMRFGLNPIIYLTICVVFAVRVFSVIYCIVCSPESSPPSPPNTHTHLTLIRCASAIRSITIQSKLKQTETKQHEML